MTTRNQVHLLHASTTEGPRYIVDRATVRAMIQFLISVLTRLLTTPPDSIAEQIPRCSFHQSQVLALAQMPFQTRELGFDSFLQQFDVSCCSCINAWMACDLPNDSAPFSCFFTPPDPTDHALPRKCTPIPVLPSSIRRDHSRPDTWMSSPSSSSSSALSDAASLFEWTSKGAWDEMESVSSNDADVSLVEFDLEDIEWSDDDESIFETHYSLPPLTVHRPRESSPSRSFRPTKRRRVDHRSRSRSPTSLSSRSSDLVRTTTSVPASSDRHFSVPEWISERHSQIEAPSSSSTVYDNSQSRKRRRIEHSPVGSAKFRHEDMNDITLDRPLCHYADEPDLWSDSSSELSDLSEVEGSTPRDASRAELSWFGRLWNLLMLRT